MVQRYALQSRPPYQSRNVYPYARGDYVLYSDYAALQAERDEYKPYYDALREAHNGYTAKGKGDNPVKEPATPADAIRELNAEWDEMLDREIDKRIKVEAERDRLAGIVERLPRFKDTGEPFIPEYQEAWVNEYGHVSSVEDWTCLDCDTWGGTYTDEDFDRDVTNGPFYSTREAAAAARKEQDDE